MIFLSTFLWGKKTHLRAYLWGSGVGGWLGKERRKSVRSWLVTSSSFQLQFSWEWLPAPELEYEDSQDSVSNPRMNKSYAPPLIQAGTEGSTCKTVLGSPTGERLNIFHISHQWLGTRLKVTVSSFRLQKDTRMLRQSTADSGTAQLSPGCNSKWEGLSHNREFKGSGDIYYFLLPKTACSLLLSNTTLI